MNSGVYAAYTGLLSRTQALETAANNLANSNTNGFRAESNYFRGVLANVGEQGLALPSDLENAVNQFGILGGNRLDLGQGQITSTGNPLDLALSGGGFFQIQTAHGIQLTRDGAFLRGADGTLTTQHGEPVLSNAGQPIVLPTGTVHVGSGGELSVALEGANQDAVHGTMQLMLVQRQAEMMQKALNIFHNDFDKTATEDLGRV